jgi:hypothetical protein
MREYEYLSDGHCCECVCRLAPDRPENQKQSDRKHNRRRDEALGTRKCARPVDETRISVVGDWQKGFAHRPESNHELLKVRAN